MCMFEEPGAFRMPHTIDVGDYGGGLPGLVLSFVIRRSDSILRYPR